MVNCCSNGRALLTHLNRNSGSARLMLESRDAGSEAQQAWTSPDFSVRNSPRRTDKDDQGNARKFQKVSVWLERHWLDLSRPPQCPSGVSGSNEYVQSQREHGSAHPRQHVPFPSCAKHARPTGRPNSSQCIYQVIVAHATYTTRGRRSTGGSRAAARREEWTRSCASAPGRGRKGHPAHRTQFPAPVRALQSNRFGCGRVV